MLSISSIGLIRDKYRNNSFNNSGLQSKPQLNVPKDTFTKQIHFGNSLPINPESNILPSLKLAMENALTGVYKKISKNGVTTEIKFIEGKKVNLKKHNKFGTILETKYKYNLKKKLTEAKDIYEDLSSNTRKYNAKGRIIEVQARNAQNVLLKIDKYQYHKNGRVSLHIEEYPKTTEYPYGQITSTHLNEGGYTTKEIESDSRGIIKTSEFFYNGNNVHVKTVTTNKDGSSLINKYSPNPENPRCLELENIDIHGTSTKQFFDKNDKIEHEIITKKDGSVYIKTSNNETNSLEFSGKHKGLEYLEDCSNSDSAGVITKKYGGNVLIEQRNTDGIPINGQFFTSDGKTYNVKYNSEGKYIYLLNDKGETADFNILAEWAESIFEKEAEIKKYSYQYPIIMPDHPKIILKRENINMHTEIDYNKNEGVHNLLSLNFSKATEEQLNNFYKFKKN